MKKFLLIWYKTIPGIITDASRLVGLFNDILNGMKLSYKFLILELYIMVL